MPYIIKNQSKLRFKLSLRAQFFALVARSIPLDTPASSIAFSAFWVHDQIFLIGLFKLHPHSIVALCDLDRSYLRPHRALSTLKICVIHILGVFVGGVILASWCIGYRCGVLIGRSGDIWRVGRVHNLLWNLLRGLLDFSHFDMPWLLHFHPLKFFLLPFQQFNFILLLFQYLEVGLALT